MRDTIVREEGRRQIDNGPRETPRKIIQVGGVCKSYGQTVALNSVSFSVRAGEALGYLGPNGAGKTTTINILCGLVRRDAGEVQVCGADIERDPVTVKEQIGVVPEDSNLYPELTCRRNLEYLGELYGLSRASKRARADQLLETFNLSDKADAPFRALSRGMKRRLTVAAALVHSPRVVFLDEPTTGLDVPSARALRSLVGDMNRDGTTVFLTTHNLAEAESLCGRIIILVKGRIVAEGTAGEIREQVAKARTLSLTLSVDVSEDSLRRACPAIAAAAVVDGAWRLQVADTHTAISQIVSFAEERGIRILAVGSFFPSLEDAFVTILEGDATRPEGIQ
jgi:ABC-2 type transport system ATP-binding protein